MRELARAEVLAVVSDRPRALVSCLSFEERSLVVPELLATAGLDRWLCIVNMDIETDISDARVQAHDIAEKAGISIQFLDASKHDPMVLADTLVRIAGEMSVDDGVHWIADVTTMTHEMLLIIVAAADEIIGAWRYLTFVYNLAAAYSGDDETHSKWISKGIREVRSVVGYPGEWSPGEPTTLIALPGFDPERMKRLVEDVEPENLIVGIACPTGDRHPWSAEKNRRIADRLLETRRGHTFDYPALDPLATMDAIIEQARTISGNVLIAPLNSKISTVAIGVLARTRPEWQICYAPALIYNPDYATSSDCFLMSSMRAIAEHVPAAPFTLEA
jgi:hypothetical protein